MGLDKKGQITIFLIIGVIILIGSMMVIYISKGLSEAEGEEAVRDAGAFPEVTSFVDLCVERTLYDGILYTGMRGGYFNVTQPYTQHSGIKVPYYFNLGQDVSPDSIDIWRENLEYYIEDQLLLCINKFKSLPQHHVRWKKELDVEVIITKDYTRAKVTLPLEISKDDKSTIVSDFLGIAKVDLNHMFDTAKHMVEIQEQGPNDIMMTLLLKHAVENDVSYDMKYDHDTVVYVVYFNDTAADREPWIYMFAVKYNWAQPRSTGLLLPMNPQFAVEGQEFMYILPTYSTDVNFYARTKMFEVDEGVIFFTPTSNQIGLHYIPIIADNNKIIESSILQLTIEDSDGPVIDYIDDQNALVGKEFNMTIPLVYPNNVPVVYTDDSQLFETNAQTGEIRFTPTINDAGIHEVTVKATTSGKIGTREFILTII